MTLNIFDLNKQSITQTITYPGMADQHRCVTQYSNNYILVLGGIAVYSSEKEFNIYNINNESWSVGTELINVRHDHSCNVVNSQLFVIGGFNKGSIDTVDVLHISQSFHSSWTTMSDTLSEGRAYHRSIVFGDNIYVIGGQGSNMSPVSQIDIINTVTKTITSPLGNALDFYGNTGELREGISVIEINGIIYCFGGFQHSEYYQWATIRTTYSPTTAPTNAPSRHPTNINEYNQTLEFIFSITNLTKSNSDIIIDEINIKMNIIPLIETAFVSVVVGERFLEYRNFEITVNDFFYYQQKIDNLETIIINSFMSYNEKDVKDIIISVSKTKQFIVEAEHLLIKYYNNSYIKFKAELINKNESDNNKKESFFEYLVSVSVVTILLVLFIVGYYIYIRRKRRYISNALVVIMGIGYYETDEDVKNPEINSVNDLEAVILDIKNVVHLFDEILNYTVIGAYNSDKSEKMFFTEKDVMNLLQYSAEILKSNLLQKNINKFDALIVILSGHGWDQSIVTSDYKLISKHAIHRYYSVKYPITRDIPRIFIYDSCDGNQQRVRRTSTELIPKTECAKFVTVEDIEVGDIWHDDENNPDYQLAIVHGANKGFQSKIDSKEGSFLITNFIQQILQYSHKRKLSQICDSIQEHLHSIGKQHIVSSFNDGIGQMRFKKNVSEIDTYDIHSEQKGMELELCKSKSVSNNIIVNDGNELKKDENN
eukprot:357074_1